LYSVAMQVAKTSRYAMKVMFELDQGDECWVKMSGCVKSSRI
jgi:hypothetical protein